MKISLEDSTCYVILDINHGTNNPLFWGESPYGGICNCFSIGSALRFDTREEAEKMVSENSDASPAKVVKVRFEETADVELECE